MIRIETLSSKETKQAAAAFAKKILKKGRRGRSALVLGLTGELGSGKTTFVQGFLRGLGVRKKITSPTFILMKKFQIPKFKSQINSKAQSIKFAYHIDCYRINKVSELLKLGLREILNNPQNIVLIEWTEKIRKMLPKNSIWLKFEHGEKENQRIIRIKY